jgi:cell division septum initiation protein DivIVA
MLQQSRLPLLADDNHASVLADRPIATEVKPPTGEYLAVFKAIERLEAKILTSPRVPLTKKTLVDEEEILTQIDSIRLNLPEIVAAAQEILQYKDRIINEAKQQALQILAEANQHAYQVANELGIIERSEHEARKIRQIAIDECEHLRQQTIIEVQRVTDRNRQELERMRAQVTLECQQIQSGADEYADSVLHNMEHQLTETLQAIQRGRQRLNPEAAGAANIEARSAQRLVEPKKRS